MKVYINMKTNEEVFEDDAESYVFEKLGLNINPIGIASSYTQDQIEFKEMVVDWFFSGDWIQKEYREVV